MTFKSSRYFLFFFLLILSACSNLIDKVDDVDFSDATISLRAGNSGSDVHQITPGENYHIVVSVTDPKKGSIAGVDLSKHTTITAKNPNLFSSSSVSGKKFMFRMREGLAVLDAGFVELTVKNAVNGTSKTTRFPIVLSGVSTINLPPDRDGNGAVAEFSVALLESSNTKQGALLLMINKTNGKSFVAAPNVMVTANGKDGVAGERGYHGKAVSGHRGPDGTDGTDGTNGGDGGQLTFVGSKKALSNIRTQTLGGKGGKGGRGGDGAVGLTEVMALSDALKRPDDIQFMRFLPDQPVRPTAEAQFVVNGFESRPGANTWRPRMPVHLPAPHRSSPMVFVKYLDGAPGYSGSAGADGAAGDTIKTEAKLDFKEEFKSFMTGVSAFNAGMLK